MNFKNYMKFLNKVTKKNVQSLFCNGNYKYCLLNQEAFLQADGKNIILQNDSLNDSASLIRFLEQEKQLIDQFEKANDPYHVLQIYNENIDKMNEMTLIFVMRAISTRSFKFSKVVIEKFKRNEIFANLIQDIIKNIPIFNEYALTELLIFYQIPLILANLDIIQSQIQIFVQKNQINPKLCAQIYYEQTLMNLNTHYVQAHLKNVLSDLNSQNYLTLYPLQLIIKANVIKYEQNELGISDFSYKVCVLLEQQVINMNVNILCQLFKNISKLNLHISTAHKKVPQILIKILEQLQDVQNDMDEKDILNVLQGYVQAPHTLDVSFLKQINLSILHTLDKQPENFTTDFIIQFVQITSHLRLGFNLDKNQLLTIGNELYTRFNNYQFIKMATIEQILVAFKESNCYHHQLFDRLLYKFEQIQDKDLLLNYSINICHDFLRNQYDCEKIMKRIFNLHQNNLKTRAPDILFKMLYIYSYPIFKSHVFQNELNYLDLLINDVITNPDDQYQVVHLIIDQYGAVKNQRFIDLQIWASKYMISKWEQLDQPSRCRFALKTTHILFPKGLWTSFNESRVSKGYSNASDLCILIQTYENTRNKNFHSFQLVGNAILNSDEQVRIDALRKIIDFFNETPVQIPINQYGNSSHLIKNIIDVLPTKNIYLKEINRSHTEMIKLGRFLKNHGISTDYPVKLILLNYDLMFEENNDIYFQAEIGEFYSENLSHKKNLLSDHQYQKLIRNQLQKIFQTMSSEIEDNPNTQSSSFLLKFGKIYVQIFENNIEQLDTVFMSSIVDQMISKLKDTTKHNNSLNICFFIFDCMIKNYIQIKGFDWQIILDKFKDSLESSSLLGINQQISLWNKQNLSKKQQIVLTDVYNHLESYYIQTNIQKHPNVISNYFTFFSQNYIHRTKLYNKILQDIKEVFKKIKPIQLIEIVHCLIKLKLHNSGLMKAICIKIQQDIQVYRHFLSEMLYFLAKLGHNEIFSQEFCRKITNFQSFDELAKNRSIQTIWSFFVLNLIDEHNIQIIKNAIEKYLTSNDLPHQYLYLGHLNDIYLISKLQYKWTFSDKVEDIFKNSISKRTQFSKDIPILTKILKQSKDKIIYNHIIHDSFYANIYLPQKKIAFLYDNSYFVCYDKSTYTGIGLLRKDVMLQIQSLYPDISFQIINEAEFLSLNEQPKQIQFLQSKGFTFN